MSLYDIFVIMTYLGQEHWETQAAGW